MDKKVDEGSWGKSELNLAMPVFQYGVVEAGQLPTFDDVKAAIKEGYRPTVDPLHEVFDVWSEVVLPTGVLESWNDHPLFAHFRQHGELIVRQVDGKPEFIGVLQNSWGEGWGGSPREIARTRREMMENSVIDHPFDYD